jgi:hypothetical protein
MISFRKYTQAYICDRSSFDFQPLNHGNIRYEEWAMGNSDNNRSSFTIVIIFYCRRFKNEDFQKVYQPASSSILLS